MHGQSQRYEPIAEQSLFKPANRPNPQNAADTVHFTKVLQIAQQNTQTHCL